MYMILKIDDFFEVFENIFFSTKYFKFYKQYSHKFSAKWVSEWATGPFLLPRGTVLNHIWAELIGILL